MTIRALHQLAYARGLPRGEVHQYLHDMAVLAFRDCTPPVASLKECTADQLEALATGLRQMFERPSKPHRPSPRKRRGRPAKDGVVRMVTGKQVEFINTLASELGWSATTLTRYLRKYFQVDQPRDLATSRAAAECIHRLLSIKGDRKRAMSHEEAQKAHN